MPLRLAIPNFNGGRYLAETLASLNAQGDDLSWHLQDAASTDGSLEIARRFARPGDTILSEPDRGQADGLNRALDRMGGEIIGWINADDRLEPGAARAVLDAFGDHPEIDLVVGQVRWIDASGKPGDLHTGHIDSLAEALDIYRVWWADRQWVQPEVFFRRALWEKVRPLDTRYHLAFDYDLWVRCFEAGARPLHLPRVLAEFRLHPEQKSRAARRAADEIRDIVAAALARNPTLPRGARLRIARTLSYDRYQSGQDYPEAAPRPTLARMLLRHPGWLLLPEVRARLRRAAKARNDAGDSGRDMA